MSVATMVGKGAGKGSVVGSGRAGVDAQAVRRTSRNKKPIKRFDIIGFIQV